MFPTMEMMSCPHLAVSAEVMQHIVQVESSANPFAIGVVGGMLMRQPKNLDEAVATVQMLDAKGYNYSLGIAQVSRANLGRFGLDTYAKAFDACGNLSAGAQILADCYASARGDWDKAFSCYYSGNFVTGFRDGYVQKVYASINRSETPATAQPIALQQSADGGSAVARRPASSPIRRAMKTVTVFASSEPNYRVGLRSMAINTVSAATVSAHSASSEAAPADHSWAGYAPGAALAAGAPRATSLGAPVVATAPTPEAASSEVFTPQVSSPNDPSTEAIASVAPPATPAPQLATPVRDRANLHQEVSDAAFVF